MTVTDLVDRLAEHKTLGAAPREELEWLVAHGSLRRLDEGEVLSAKGVPVAGLFVVLTGHIAIFVDRGAGRHKVIEWRAGDVAGMLPYSRLVSPPGDSVAQEPSEILAIPRDDLAAMIRDCHEITSILVHKMLDRSPGLHVERPARREDGLAREAVRRAGPRAEQPGLRDRTQRRAARRPAGGRRAGDARAGRREADRCRSSPPSTRCARPASPRACTGVLSPIQQAEREDAIADWLADHGVDAAIAGPLAETAVTLDALDQIAAAVSGPALGAVLRWAAAGCSVRGIAVGDSGSREADLRPGRRPSRDSRTWTRRRWRSRWTWRRAWATPSPSSSRRRARNRSPSPSTCEPDLPRVRGFVGELNQIWANLIDNALDAVPDSGRVDVTRDARAAARRGARRSTTGPAFRPRSASACSSRSSRPSPSAKAPAWASTSSGAWSATTTPRSRSRRRPGEPSFESRLPLADADRRRETTREQARPPGR